MTVPYAVFADFAGTIGADNLALLEALYQDPEDVDFYVGGMLELFGGGTGTDDPVFECVLSQTLMTKVLGDIYFPLNPENPYPFTEDQLDMFESLVNGDFVCAISDQLRNIRCSGSNPLDLSAWKVDEHHHHHHHHSD